MFDGLGSEVILKTQPLKTVEDVKRIVACYFRIPVKDMEGASRKPNFSHPRQVAMALAYKRLQKFGETYESIGASFGGRHYTTVIFACRKFGVHCDETNPHAAFGRAGRRSAKRMRASVPMRPCKPPAPKQPPVQRQRSLEELERAFWLRQAGFTGAA